MRFLPRWTGASRPSSSTGTAPPCPTAPLMPRLARNDRSTLRRRHGSRRRHGNPPRQRRRAARRATVRPRKALSLSQPRLGGLRRRPIGATARRAADRDAGRGGGARRCDVCNRREPRRARPPGGDRVAASQPAQDRPDPGTGVGRPAEGEDRRAARRRREPAASGRDSTGCAKPSRSPNAPPGTPASRLRR